MANVDEVWKIKSDAFGKLYELHKILRELPGADTESIAFNDLRKGFERAVTEFLVPALDRIEKVENVAKQHASDLKRQAYEKKYPGDEFWPYGLP